MSKCYRAMILTAAALLLLAGASLAAIPTRMTVEGKLTNAAGDPVPAGLKSFTFKIYDAPAGGTEIWPAGPGEIQPLSTDVHGLWTAEIGALVPLTATVFSGGDRWLETTVNDGVNPVETLTRVRLNTSPYTFQSEQSSNATDARNADSLGGLPPSAYAAGVHTHDATTITDEPGIAWSTNPSFITLPQGTTTMTDVVVCTLSTPSAGYIAVRAKCLTGFSLTTSHNYVYTQIDENAGGSLNADYSLVGYYDALTTNESWSTVYSERVFHKGTAGAYIFRLEARAWEGNAPGAVTRVQLATISATFYPTAYGTVAP